MNKCNVDLKHVAIGTRPASEALFGYSVKTFMFGDRHS